MHSQNWLNFTSKVTAHFSDTISMRLLLISIFFLVSGLLADQISDLSGFGDTPWRSTYKDVRDKYASLSANPNSRENVKILSEVPNRLLVVKRNNVQYIYRFYREPKEVREVNEYVKGASPSSSAPPADAVKKTEETASGLFSVGVVFSPVESGLAKKSLERYGKPTKEYLVENSYNILKEKEKTVVVQKDPAAPSKDVLEPEDIDLDDKELENKVPMALIWDLGNKSQEGHKGGFVIQWNEPYKKKLYTKRVDYFSSELSGLITTDFKKYFSARETKILTDLLSEPKLSETKTEDSTSSKTVTPAKDPAATPAKQPE